MFFNVLFCWIRYFHSFVLLILCFAPFALFDLMISQFAFLDLSNLHPYNVWCANTDWHVQFELAQFGCRVSFLDLEVYRNKFGEWHTELYFKTTDVHAYLSPFSTTASEFLILT